MVNKLEYFDGLLSIKRSPKAIEDVVENGLHLFRRHAKVLGNCATAENSAKE